MVAEELHKDEGKHLHAFVKYDKRVALTSTKWDLKEDGKTYHGNYQVAKSWAAVEKYCKKDGNFIASFSTEDARAKKAKTNVETLAMTT